jgi:hypothetical protein
MKRSLYLLQVKIVSLCCILAGLTLCFLPYSCRMDQKERFLIEALLQDMVFEQGFAYSLFGNKPVSLAGYPLTSSFDNVFFHKKPLSISEAWPVLEKTIAHYYQGNYVLLKQLDQNPQKHHIFQVLLVNKSSFIQTVTEHLDLFREFLGGEIHPKSLLDEILLNERSLWDIIDNNDALYGILLGYGKKNSLAFKRRRELGQVFDPYCQDLQKLPPFCPKPSEKFHSSEEEYNYFKREHCFFDMCLSPLSPLMPPYFMSMKNYEEETSLLAEEYKKTFKNIIEIYAKGDFLSITLERLLQRKLTLTPY